MGCESERNVAVFWDYENCEIPSSSDGYSAAAGIRNLVEKFGVVKLFKAYLESGRHSNLTPRLELISSGVDIIDCPHNGKKDVVDMTLIVDMLTHALDHPASSTTIVLISGDGDYMRALSSLRNRKYYTVVITPRDCSHSALKYQAYSTHDWYSDVIAPMQRQNFNIARSPGIPKHANFQGRVPQIQLLTPPSTGVEPSSTLPEIKVNVQSQTQDAITSSSPSDKGTAEEKKGSDTGSPTDSDDKVSVSPPKTPSPESSTQSIPIEEPQPSRPTWANVAASPYKPLFSNHFHDQRGHVFSERPKLGDLKEWPATEPYMNDPLEQEWTANTEGEVDIRSDPKLYSEVAASAQHANVDILASTMTSQDQISGLNPDIVIPSVAMYHNKKPAREYKALVKVLESQRLQGSTRVVSSVLGSALLKEDENVYRRAQVSKLKDYLLLAQKAGVVILGREDLRENGNRWIALHPEYHGYGRRPVVPPVST